MSGKPDRPPKRPLNRRSQVEMRLPYWVTSASFAGRMRTTVLSADDPLVLLKTSGSTSRPKRVLLTHGNALASSRAHRASISHGRDERSLVCLPMSYGYCHTDRKSTRLNSSHR